MIFPTKVPVRRLLCLGAHADDLEIGCGGTVLRLLEAVPGIEVHWHVFSATGPRRREARASARHFLAEARRPRIAVHSFRESYFPQAWAAIKNEFERIKRRLEPDLVLTHAREDRHQDHRVLSDLAWNTFRQSFLLEYEIPKYDGDLGQPNYYVALDEGIARRKIAAILKYFPSQAHRHWFTEDTFRALLRLRGIEGGPQTRLAEAFYARKMVV